MPVLKSLYINLNEEEQVDQIMRLLPELEYLNGLPVDRDALEDDENLEPTTQNDPAMAIQQEVSNNVGDQVNELPADQEESSFYNSNREIGETAGYNTIGSINQGLNTSLQSVQSQTKNASLLSEHLNTDELEAIAQCFDNIREMRKRNPKMVGNDDNALGDQFDE